MATGIEEHNDYAIHFIEAPRNQPRCPGAKVAEVLVIFFFRGNQVVREAMHTLVSCHSSRHDVIVNADD